MKRTSEAEVGAALRAIDLGDDLRVWAYKPADAAGSGMKPADYLVWFLPVDQAWTTEARARSTFVEVKDTDRAGLFPLSEIRPSQRLAIARCRQLGMPYWLAIWWRKRKCWTISDATALDLNEKSVSLVALSSRYGVDCTKAELQSFLRMALLGELR